MQTIRSAGMRCSHRRLCRSVALQAFWITPALHGNANPGEFAMRDDGADPWQGNPSMGMYECGDGKWLALAPVMDKFW